MAATDYMIPFL